MKAIALYGAMALCWLVGVGLAATALAFDGLPTPYLLAAPGCALTFVLLSLLHAAPRAVSQPPK